MPRIIVDQQMFPGIPVDVFTSPETPYVRRLQVDIGQTGFFAGREFRIFKELTVTGTPYVMRIIVPGTLKGMFIEKFRLTCYQGSIAMRAWRAGTPGGTFTPMTIWPNNAIPDVAGYTGLVTVAEGGTLTAPSQQSDAIIVYANEAGKSSTTSIGEQTGERGLAPATYYLEFSRLPGTTVDGLGTVSMTWEERPLAGT